MDIHTHIYFFNLKISRVYMRTSAYPNGYRTVCLPAVVDLFHKVALLSALCRQCNYSEFSVSNLGEKMSTEGISAHDADVCSIFTSTSWKFNFSLGNGCSLGNGNGSFISRYFCIM